MRSKSLEGATLSEFKDIYDNYEPFIRKALYWMLNKETIDDVVQETFVKIWKSLENFQSQSKLQTWIYRIAVNAAYDYMRKEKKTSQNIELKDDLVDLKSSAEVQSMNQQLVKKAIGKLPDKQRVAFVLHYVQGLKQEEIAETLEVPVGTVKSRLSLGKKEVKKELMKMGAHYE